MDVEAAMLAAEDEDDVAAMRVTKEEMAKELDEFDEDAPIEQLDEGGGGEHHPPDQSRAAAKAARKAPPPPPPPPSSSSGLLEGDGPQLCPPGATGLEVEDADADQDARDERDMEREFASWQEKVGPDFRALQSALKPVERYALRFRTDCDPYYSLFYISEQARLDAMREEALVSDQWDVEEIERDKEEEVRVCVASLFDSPVSVSVCVAGVSRVERGGVGGGQHQPAAGGGGRAEVLVSGGAQEAAAGKAAQGRHRRRMGPVSGRVG